MSQGCWLSLLLGSILAATGCTSLRLDCDCTTPVEGPLLHCPEESANNRSAKTLFDWSIGNDDAAESVSGGNGNSNGNEKSGANGAGPEANGGEQEEDDEIVTDRPDFTEASSTVGRNRVQLEAGYTFFSDRFNGSRLTAHSYPEILLRIGLFADWFEVRLGQNFASEREVGPDGIVESASGAEDLYLGVKLALTEQKKWLPEMALILQMTVPTGADAFSDDEVLPGLNLLYGWDVIPDLLAVGGSTQMNRAHGVHTTPAFPGVPPFADLGETEVDHSYLELAQSLTINYTLTPKLGAYTEWFAFFPHSSLDPDVAAEHYLDGGFTYKVTSDLQLDVRGGVGLNDHAVDWFVGAGLAVRR